MHSAVTVTDLSVDTLEHYRRELAGHCRRMLRSSVDADDAVQETIVRAWRGAKGFEGRAAVRSWLYRIATNVCLDMLQSRQRRAEPMDLGPSTAEAFSADGDPADLVEGKEIVRVALVTTIQHLSERQRTVFMLRDVLGCRVREVAALLDTSVASVNSALQRARATLATLDVDTSSAPSSAQDHDVRIARSVEAFERYDIDALVVLLTQRAGGAGQLARLYPSLCRLHARPNTLGSL
jgi:RNA polymerase sigma-70 factor (ECF subfamily)